MTNFERFTIVLAFAAFMHMVRIRFEKLEAQVKELQTLYASPRP